MLCLVFYLSLIAATTSTHGSIDTERKPYIVYMGDVPEIGTMATKDHHHNLLVEAIKDESIAIESIIHSYGKSFNAFAAMLTPEEAKRLKEKETVISVFPDKLYKLYTTRSRDFIGMPLTVARNYSVESNLIVGLLDTGR
ncbi:hypothetical protein NE237_016761 [Protea cynaroides]|uniref:Inhibitor I9 domain-containing protein n=1 Tax=Protea cynaroides TaxID=273540 RepID=A0A9Q0HEF9_9MAGN|nr:hypothetical protein NE237_016761 [Protea cynaroides]